MAHTITVSPDKKYIILKVVGDINRHLAKEQDEEAHALGEKLGIHRYLVDLLESRNTDSVINTYEFAYEDMEVANINRKARVALLVSPDDHSHDFVETVARNAGLDVTLFRDREQAVRHLEAE